PTITLHEQGDVTLIIGEEEQRVVVSTSILRRASPVWQAMFGERWAESEATEVPLPDDDVEAMVTVLRIAHLRFDEVPQKHGLSFKQLLSLAIICDKYDTVKIVRPFMYLHEWHLKWRPQVAKPGYEEWLFISWTFGYPEIFEIVAQHLLMTVYIDQSGNCLTENGKPIAANMPPGIIERILKVREDTISAILRHCYATLERVKLTRTCQIPDPKPNQSSYRSTLPDTYSSEKECHSMILGSLVGALNDLRIGSRPTASQYHYSISHFSQFLSTVSISAYTKVDLDKLYDLTDRRDRYGYTKERPSKNEFISAGVQSHATCADAVQLITPAKEIIAKMPSAVLDSHLKHMEKQATK
ncbi:hypothetical protein K469DRAFT_512956, partial [Zopfia rhizophila CBS 207.26]